MAAPLENGSMIQAVSKMEDTFRMADTELSNLERKLEVEYSSMFDEQNSMSNELRNPVKALNRIADVKAEYSKIKEDVADIQKLQSEALAQVKTEFDKILSAISSLNNKVLHSEVDDEAYNKEQQLLSLLAHMSEKTGNRSSKTESVSNAAPSAGQSSAG